VLLSFESASGASARRSTSLSRGILSIRLVYIGLIYYRTGPVGEYLNRYAIDIEVIA